ncbi:CDP-glycerol glycerophosphotransferase family protein [Amphibacillus cookii]|uniref:CDP-glycerol glycerophosphotransferase family protein n=1 Tax=Amphibacillus cookii TaxID=767787 RepID=UPI00195C4607|nr:CDP-glycerol glycerophosphotransferase [Amphibacillus cookii]
MKISLIIPVYNTELYLKDCLTSIINQTYPYLEIIIIDDASDDKSVEIINDFMKRDPRIKMFQNRQTLGVAASRNIGLQQMTGDYVFFLDSDDFLDRQALEKLIRYSQEYNVISGKNISVTKFLTRNEEIESSEISVYKGKRVKLFKNRSILNTLINVDVIRQQKLRFSESERYFSDLTMITDIISSTPLMAYCKTAIYYKRRRDNPIDAPSLMQEDMGEKIKCFASVLTTVKNKKHLSQKALTYIDNQFLNYYRRAIILYFRDHDKIDQQFHILQQCVVKLEPHALTNKSLILKREINAIKSNKLKKYKKIINTHNQLRLLKWGLKSKQKFYTYLYRQFFIKKAIDEKLVLFESFLGKNYSDSPKYIYEYMLKHNYDYKYVWVFNEVGKAIPGNAKQVKRFSLKYYYYLAKAKYWVSNSRIPKRFDKHPDNIYLQTWHGTPLKQLVFDMKDIHSANPNYKRDFFVQSRRWDYLISPNQYSSDIFRRAFKYDKKMLEYGYPRNDLLYKNNHSTYIKNLKDKLNIPTNKKVILYAPTWRDDQFFARGKYEFNLELDLEALRQSISSDYVVLLRMHYFIANELDISPYSGFAFDFSNYDDIAEIYLVSDILITDYSSVFFDYAHLKRPILFYTYDLEKYRDKLRGFYIDIKTEVPGPLLYNTQQVIKAINEIDQVQDSYRQRYEKFYHTFCKWDNGNASEEIVNKVFGKLR